jgi:DNA-binding NtrC family response regulator
MKKNESFLVVDDEEEIRKLLYDILTEEGFIVLSAENATIANKIFTEKQPRFVLLDIWMPGQDGISLLKRWQKHYSLDKTAIIMMSGHATIENAMEATKYGAVDFVEKPISLPSLLEMIKKYSLSDKKKEVKTKNHKKLERLYKMSYKEAHIKFDELYFKYRLKKHKKFVEMAKDIGIDRASIYRKLNNIKKYKQNS